MPGVPWQWHTTTCQRLPWRAAALTHLGGRNNIQKKCVGKGPCGFTAASYPCGHHRALKVPCPKAWGQPKRVRRLKVRASASDAESQPNPSPEPNPLPHPLLRPLYALADSVHGVSVFIVSVLDRWYIKAIMVFTCLCVALSLLVKGCLVPYANRSLLPFACEKAAEVLMREVRIGELEWVSLGGLSGLHPLASIADVYVGPADQEHSSLKADHVLLQLDAVQTLLSKQITCKVQCRGAEVVAVQGSNFTWFSFPRDNDMYHEAGPAGNKPPGHPSHGKSTTPATSLLSLSSRPSQAAIHPTSTPPSSHLASASLSTNAPTPLSSLVPPSTQHLECNVPLPSPAAPTPSTASTSSPAASQPANHSATQGAPHATQPAQPIATPSQQSVVTSAWQPVAIPPWQQSALPVASISSSIPGGSNNNNSHDRTAHVSNQQQATESQQQQPLLSQQVNSEMAISSESLNITTLGDDQLAAHNIDSHHHANINDRHPYHHISDVPPSTPDVISPSPAGILPPCTDSVMSHPIHATPSTLPDNSVDPPPDTSTSTCDEVHYTPFLMYNASAPSVSSPVALSSEHSSSLLAQAVLESNSAHNPAQNIMDSSSPSRAQSLPQLMDPSLPSGTPASDLQGPHASALRGSNLSESARAGSSLPEPAMAGSQRGTSTSQVEGFHTASESEQLESLQHPPRRGIWVFGRRLVAEREYKLKYPDSQMAASSAGEGRGEEDRGKSLISRDVSNKDVGGVWRGEDGTERRVMVAGMMESAPSFMSAEMVPRSHSVFAEDESVDGQPDTEVTREDSVVKGDNASQASTPAPESSAPSPDIVAPVLPEFVLPSPAIVTMAKYMAARVLESWQPPTVALSRITLSGGTVVVYIEGEAIPRRIEDLELSCKFGRDYHWLDLEVSGKAWARDPLSDKCTMLNSTAKRHLRHVTAGAQVGRVRIFQNDELPRDLKEELQDQLIPAVLHSVDLSGAGIEQGLKAEAVFQHAQMEKKPMVSKSKRKAGAAAASEGGMGVGGANPLWTSNVQGVLGDVIAPALEEGPHCVTINTYKVLDPTKLTPKQVIRLGVKPKKAVGSESSTNKQAEKDSSKKEDNNEQPIPALAKATGGDLKVRVTCRNIMVPDRWPDLMVSVKGDNLHAPMIERIVKLPMDVYEGRADGELKIRSFDEETWAFPQFYGKVHCKDVDLHFWDAPDDLLNVSMDLLFEKDRMYLHGASGYFGAVPLTVTGDMDLHPDTGTYRLSASVSPVEANAIRATLGVRPIPFPVAGGIRGVLHCTGPLEFPLFSGTAVAVRPSPEALSAGEDTAALAALKKLPGAVAAYDKVPLMSASAVFTVDMSSKMLMLHSGHAQPVGGGQMIGSGRMWVAEEAEEDPRAVRMQGEGQGLDADLLLQHYLPQGVSLPSAIRMGPLNVKASLEGSHVSPVVRVRLDAPASSVTGSAVLSRPMVQASGSGPHFQAAATLLQSFPDFEKMKMANTQAEATLYGSPLITGCDLEGSVTGLDLLQMASSSGGPPATRVAAGGAPVRLKVAASTALSVKLQEGGEPLNFSGTIQLADVRLNQLSLARQLSGQVQLQPSALHITARGLRPDELLDVHLSLPTGELGPEPVHSMRSTAEQSTAEQSTAEQSTVEQSTVEQSMTEPSTQNATNHSVHDAAEQSIQGAPDQGAHSLPGEAEGGVGTIVEDSMQSRAGQNMQDAAQHDGALVTGEQNTEGRAEPGGVSEGEGLEIGTGVQPGIDGRETHNIEHSSQHSIHSSSEGSRIVEGGANVEVGTQRSMQGVPEHDACEQPRQHQSAEGPPKSKPAAAEQAAIATSTAPTNAQSTTRRSPPPKDPNMTPDKAALQPSGLQASQEVGSTDAAAEAAVSSGQPSRMKAKQELRSQAEGESSFVLRRGPLLVSMRVNSDMNSGALRLAGMKLDELELASLRGQVGELEVEVDLPKRSGHAHVYIDSPRYSGLQGVGFSSHLRWDGAVLRLEQAVLQQRHSRYEVQGEYILPPNTTFPDTTLFNIPPQEGSDSGNAPLLEQNGFWRVMLTVPQAELEEILPAARLLRRATAVKPSDYDAAKREFLAQMNAIGIQAPQLLPQVRAITSMAKDVSMVDGPPGSRPAPRPPAPSKSVLPGLQELKGRWSGSVQAVGGAGGATSVAYSVKGQNWKWGAFGLDQVVVAGTAHETEGVRLDELVLRSGEARLSMQGNLLCPKQNATIILNDFPAAMLHPLYRALPALQNAAPAVSALPKKASNQGGMGPIGAMSQRLEQTIGNLVGKLSGGTTDVTSWAGSPINGQLELKGVLGGSATAPEGQLKVRLYDGAIGAVRLAKAEAEMGINSRQRLNLEVDLVPAESAGHLKLSGRMPLLPLSKTSGSATAGAASGGASDEEPMDVRVSVKDGGMSLVTSISPDVCWVGGNAAIELSMKGSVTAPQVQGSATLSKASITSPYLKYPVTNVGGTIKVQGSTLRAENLEARVGRQGHVRIRGDLPLSPSTRQAAPEPASPGKKGAAAPVSEGLSIDIGGLEVRVRNLYTGSVDAGLQLMNSLDSPTVGGSLRFSKGTAYLIPQGGAGPAGPISPEGGASERDMVVKAFAALKAGKHRNTALAPLMQSSGSSSANAPPSTPSSPPLTNVLLDRLKVALGPELRAVFPLVINVGVSGEVELNGPADPSDIQVKGMFKLENGVINLVATQFNLDRDHPNTITFVPEHSLDPNIDVCLLSSDLRCLVQGSSSSWQDHVVLTHRGGGPGTPGEGERVDPEEVARIFEGRLAETLLAEDGQLAFSNLASSTFSTLLPKIETHGQLGKARWRLVSALPIPGLLSLEPSGDPTNLLSTLTMGTEVEIQFGKSVQAAMAYKAREAEGSGTEWTLIYQISKKLRLQAHLKSHNPLPTILLQYSSEAPAR